LERLKASWSVASVELLHVVAAAVATMVLWLGFDAGLAQGVGATPPDCQKYLSMQPRQPPSGASFYFLVPLLSFNMSLHIKLLKYLSTINLFLVFLSVPIHLNSWVIFLNREICARCGIFFPCVSNHLPWKAWCVAIYGLVLLFLASSLCIGVQLHVSHGRTGLFRAF
jgi:hypothetical protein